MESVSSAAAQHSYHWYHPDVGVTRISILGVLARGQALLAPSFNSQDVSMRNRRHYDSHVEMRKLILREVKNLRKVTGLVFIGAWI
jgi:hypothetical protein